MFVLASQSPRRKELMGKYIASSFLIDPSNSDELQNDNLSPEENVMNIAKTKGENVFLRHPDDIIISADTIVVLDNKIYGKPKDEEDAYDILKKLSGKTHFVITAYYIKTKSIIIERIVKSKVYFNSLSDEFILSYIKTKIPMDKAGAYAIQDEYGKQIVNHYEGSLSNIIGFPYEEIIKDLKNNQLL